MRTRPGLVREGAKKMVQKVICECVVQRADHVDLKV